MTNEPTKNSYAQVRKIARKNGLKIVSMTNDYLSLGYEAYTKGYVDADSIAEFFKTADGWVFAKKSKGLDGNYLISSKSGGQLVTKDPRIGHGGNYKSTFRSAQGALKNFMETSHHFYNFAA